MASFSLILLVPVVAVFAVNLPHTFTNGTVADADEVNANFEALANNSLNDFYKVSIETGSLPDRDRYRILDIQRIYELCADDDGCRVRNCLQNTSSSGPRCRAGIFGLSQNSPVYIFSVGSDEISNLDGVSGVIDILDSSIGFSGSCTFTDADQYAGNVTNYLDDGIGFGLKITNNLQTCSIAFYD